MIHPIQRFRQSRRWRTAGRAATLSALGGLLAVLSIGCGGGGGGGSSSGGGTAPFGRSFTFANGGQTFSMSLDANGRFTVFATDPTAAPNGAGAQGTEGTDGSFFAQSTGGTLQFSGRESTDGASVTGTVQRNSVNVFAFDARLVPPGAATSGSVSGTYTGTSGTTSVLLTIDPTSHATLFAGGTGPIGGAPLTFAANGDLTSADGKTAAHLDLTTEALTITKLHDATINIVVTVKQATRVKWTFLVYMNAANNLQEFGPLNVNQMEEVGSSKDVNIVVQWKQATCSDCGTPDWTGTRRYFVTKDSDTSTVHSQVVQDLGQTVDMGDWHALRDFVVWGQQNYPADHYALVIWDHGAGWRNTRAGRLPVFPRSVSIDDSTNHEIQTWELPEALNVTPHMDTVIFDASLMQMLEVAYEIRGVTPVVTGSEESPPGEGYVYNTFLADLVANPDMTGAQLGTQIVNRTLDAYGPNGSNTQSALDTTKLQAIADKVDAFSSALLNHKGDSSAIEISARSVGTANGAQYYAYSDNKDLYDYAGLIKNGAPSSAADLKNAAGDVQTAITAAIIAERHGSQGNSYYNGTQTVTKTNSSHGIAIYVPDPLSYLSTYSNLALARSAPHWPQWLQGQP